MRRESPLSPAPVWSRKTLIAILLLLLTAPLAMPQPAEAQIQIGFCQGQPGELVTVTVEFVICCPPIGTISTVSATAGPVLCSDPMAVMAALSTAIGGIMFGGAPVFGAPFPVPSPVPGQGRIEIPLAPGFVASGCCVIGGGIDFDCGTFSLRIDSPCAKTGDPGGRGRKTKLCFLAPPPGPSTFAMMFEGCPIILVPLDGTETATGARDKVLAALLAAGYTAFINGDGKLEVTMDCDGTLPGGVDEVGLGGGLPMPLGVIICPPELPVGVEDRSWGRVKDGYRL